MELREPVLTEEISSVLSRYQEIQRDEKRLRAEKKMLQNQLREHLEASGTNRWKTTVGRRTLEVSAFSYERVDCDEDALFEQLGPRYLSLLRPDAAKMRKHFFDIRQQLKPVLALIGSPHAKSIRWALDSGVVTLEEIDDSVTFSKRCWVSVGPPRKQRQESQEMAKAA